MKKIFLEPKAKVFMVDSVSPLMDQSFVIKPGEEPINDNDFELSRDNGGNSVWDDIW